MVRTIWLCGLLLAMPAVAQNDVRYVSDEISIVLRAGASADSASLGSLNSGAKLELIEAKASYARVRAGDGRVGWVPERYLKSEPPARASAQRAKEQLAKAQNDLAQSQTDLKKVQNEQAKLLKDFARIAESPGGATPASAELVQEAEQLRARVQQLEQERSDQAAAKDSDKALEEQRTMLLGGALVGGGFVLALLLHWLWPGRRRGGF